MDKEQLQQMVKWLNQQIMYSNECMNEARQGKNYGRETQYEGMREAFARCLNKLSKT
jgi:hypothetical protein